jgi:CRISPR-associated protein Cmr3
MNELLLAPTDILFFRDGRPMGGSLAGHGAAWPLPTVTNSALHAALWRSGLAENARTHGRNRPDSPERTERFGSLTTAGPFPVCTSGLAPTWFFPAPADAKCDRISPDEKPSVKGHIYLTLKPTSAFPKSSSNPLPLTVASTQPATKDKTDPWWSEGAWNAYLGKSQRNELAARIFTKTDSDFSDREATLGIGIDPETATQHGERLYSAHYLRLRDGWNLGLFAETQEKTEIHGQRVDLLRSLIGAKSALLIGGQQRLCTATCTPTIARLPLPLGQLTSFAACPLLALGDDKPRHLVKWVLLTPSIFPKLLDANPDHPGGWLPSWVHPATHGVQLRAPLTPRDVAKESRDAYRARVQTQPTIAARLVAALVGKPLPVTGWSLGTPDNPEAPVRESGAKSTHLAIPAGSVYYFACDTAKDAEALATALNWHGNDEAGTTIRNRRSTLLGEKGFGLGVCGSWSPLA